MSRICAAAALAALLLAVPAHAKTPRACKHLHGHTKKVCVRKHSKPKKDVLPLGIPTTTSLLDGSTVTTAAGTFGVTGQINGFIPGKVALNSATNNNLTSGALTPAAGAPCTAVQLPPANPYGPPAGVMVLNADGTVLVSLHLALPDCGGDTVLLMGGQVGDAGLNALTLDSVPGPVTAHLVVKVDLSGTP